MIHHLDEALELHCQLVSCFKKASFDLVKWTSNSPEFNNNIAHDVSIGSLIDWDDSQSLKVLGMGWNPTADVFSFQVDLEGPESRPCTKRVVLSNLAKIWDPLGLISPVTVHCKILLQTLWTLQLDWDEPAPSDFTQLWKQIMDEIKLLAEIKIPRHIAVVPESRLTLIGFCDASEKACSAVIYSKVEMDNCPPVVTLLAAKSKIAPLKKISIPRLELNAVLILARLISLVWKQYCSRYPIQKVVCLSDSTIALHWITTSPHKWQTYVANRVTKIQELMPPGNWFHVTTQHNSNADCLSRGLLPSELLVHPTWFNGPSYLTENQTTWPITTIGQPTTPFPEEKRLVLVTVDLKVNFLLDVAKKYSSWSKILHILVYVFRFLKQLPKRSQITIKDLKFVELKLLLAVQKKYFGKDFQKKYSNLSPFKDDSEIIRVGGRLSNSSLPYENKHPILLPKEEHGVKLVVTDLHEKNFHTGPSLLLAILRQNYWVLAGRPLVRKITQSCNFCFRFQPKNNYPIMGNLPKFRIEEAKPFVNTGLDFAGPYNITLTKHRGVKSQKSYLCLFVCLSTKAVHLGLVSDLSKDAFLNALKRFLARRGPIATLWSDNGTNFIGAKNYLSEVYQMLSSPNVTDALHTELVSNKIEWKMIPPVHHIWVVCGNAV